MKRILYETVRAAQRASDHTGMAFLRRLVQELLIVSPFLLLLSIAVGTRTHVDTFEPVAYPAWMQSRIRAYIDPVSQVEAIVEQGQPHVQPEATRETAFLWLKEFDEGKLRELPSMHSDDSMREGVKNQILQAADALCKGLGQMGRNALRGGNAKRASADVLLAIELAQRLKYNDLYSVGMMSQRQRNLLEILANAAPGLDAEAKRAARSRLVAVMESNQSLAPIVVRARQHWAASQVSGGKVALSIEDVGRLVSNEGWASNQPVQQQVEQRLNRMLFASRASDLPEYVSETGYAGTMEQATARTMRDLIEMLK
ncbi:MAG: hypothetical protein HZC36_12295 [Armatimonadetes bacterium]|nr:hypothetical protein [Armatimonadota bacterium]